MRNIPYTPRDNFVLNLKIVSDLMLELFVYN